MKEIVIHNAKRNLKKDMKPSFLKLEKMHEIFAIDGIEEWQELYTEEEVNECFQKFVKLVNYNEIHKHDNLVSITALSSGFHIGASNWLLEIGTHRIGILRNSSEEGEFRHPLALFTEPLKNLDVLIVGNIARPLSETEQELWKKEIPLGLQIN